MKIETSNKPARFRRTSKLVTSVCIALIVVTIVLWVKSTRVDRHGRVPKPSAAIRVPGLLTQITYTGEGVHFIGPQELASRSRVVRQTAAWPDSTLRNPFATRTRRIGDVSRPFSQWHSRLGRQRVVARDLFPFRSVQFESPAGGARRTGIQRRRISPRLHARRYRGRRNEASLQASQRRQRRPKSL